MTSLPNELVDKYIIILSRACARGFTQNPHFRETEQRQFPNPNRQ